MLKDMKRLDVVEDLQSCIGDFRFFLLFDCIPYLHIVINFQKKSSAVFHVANLYNPQCSQNRKPANYNKEIWKSRENVTKFKKYLLVKNIHGFTIVRSIFTLKRISDLH